MTRRIDWALNGAEGAEQLEQMACKGHASRSVDAGISLSGKTAGDKFLTCPGVFGQAAQSIGDSTFSAPARRSLPADSFLWSAMSKVYWFVDLGGLSLSRSMRNRYWPSSSGIVCCQPNRDPLESRFCIDKALTTTCKNINALTSSDVINFLSEPVSMYYLVPGDDFPVLFDGIEQRENVDTMNENVHDSDQVQILKTHSNDTSTNVSDHAAAANDDPLPKHAIRRSRASVCSTLPRYDLGLRFSR